MWIGPPTDERFAFGYTSGLRIKEESGHRLPVICNPKTGRYMTFASFQLREENLLCETHSFFGFDPIDKQFKVLCMGYPSRYHGILRLGTGERRSKKWCFRHENVSDGICINGVLFYLAKTNEYEGEDKKFVIICFDVRSEIFKFLYPKSFCQLINYNGNLGLIHYDYADDAMELLVWVLQQWSKHKYTLRDDKFLPYHVSVVGVTATGEIVLSMGDYTSEVPFYVFYFNPKRNTLQRVEINGFGECHEALDKPSRVHVFVDDCSRFYAFADQADLLESSICVPYVNTQRRREYYSEDSDENLVEDGEVYVYDYEYI